MNTVTPHYQQLQCKHNTQYQNPHYGAKYS